MPLQGRYIIFRLGKKQQRRKENLGWDFSDKTEILLPNMFFNMQDNIIYFNYTGNRICWNRNTVLWKTSMTLLNANRESLGSGAWVVTALSDLWKEHKTPSFPFTPHLMRGRKAIPAKGPAAHSQMGQSSHPLSLRGERPWPLCGIAL